MAKNSDTEFFEQKKIEIKGFDFGDRTSIRVSCHRETSRLHRMLHVFDVAMTLAGRHGLERELKNALIELHDCKGELTATWKSQSAFSMLRIYVDAAWRDQYEWSVRHIGIDGRLYYEGEVTEAEIPSFNTVASDGKSV